MTQRLSMRRTSLQAPKVFSCRNGDRGGRSDFGHFIHAGGGESALSRADHTSMVCRSRSPLSTALTMSSVNQVNFIASTFPKAAEDHFVVAIFSAGILPDIIVRIFPDFPIDKSSNSNHGSVFTPHRVPWPGRLVKQASSFPNRLCSACRSR